jgi:malonyl-CoA decarboxylase
MNTTSFLGDMLQAITDRGRRLLSLNMSADSTDPVDRMEALCEALLSGRGEASGMALANAILTSWRELKSEAQLDFMQRLLLNFGPKTDALERAIDAYRGDSTPSALLALHEAAEPRRQELIRRFNLAPNGIESLVRMREALLKMKTKRPDLEAVDSDFAHLFSSWFNRGFLMLKPISWSTPADILEKIIRYEAVHQIGSWDELRLRLAPKDRRCFAFFHPQLAYDPLIFVEVALTREMPDNIAELLREDRVPIAEGEATTAVFYSISNCQDGLRGISFGNFLIKQVVEDLKRDLPRLQQFVTLSPVPGFAGWLEQERRSQTSETLSAADMANLDALDDSSWPENAELRARLEPALSKVAAWYFLKARNTRGRVIDPVARFHLGNGARLERINFLADRSPRAMRQSHGLMVNYLYDFDDIEKNHEAFATRSEVVAAGPVRRLVPTDRSARSILPVAAANPSASQDQTSSKEFSA